MSDAPFTHLRAVVLDWAGTIIDFGSRAPVGALGAALRQHGIEADESEIRRFMGMRKPDHVKAILALPTVRDRYEAAHGTSLPVTAADDVFAFYRSHQPTVVAESSDPIPYAATTLSRLRARGLRIGTSTGFDRATIDALRPRLAGEGFDPDAIVTASDCEQGRPHPDMLRENARQLHVDDPARIVKVDDAPIGITAARRFGCWSVGVTISGTLIGCSPAEWASLSAADQADRRASAIRAHDAAEADAVIDTVADLEAVLDALDARLRAGERPAPPTVPADA